MNINLPLPLFLLRRLVRQNPWLLSDSGRVRRTASLNLGPIALDIEAEAVLPAAKKAKLQAEADAGTLFGKP